MTRQNKSTELGDLLNHQIRSGQLKAGGQLKANSITKMVISIVFIGILFVQAEIANATDVNVRDFYLQSDPDSTGMIQRAIDFVASSVDGGTVHFPSGPYIISSTINAKTGVKLEGVYGEPPIPGQTILYTGSRLIWNGANNQTILRVFDVRVFRLDGMVIEGNGKTGLTGILLDSDNIPSGSNNSFEYFSIINCLVGIQWGTTDIAGGSKQNDGIIFRQFTIKSTEANSRGFVLNSGNAAQYSSIENGGIEVDSVAIDIVVANQLQLKKVVSGGKTAIAFCRVSIGINILIEGCESENTAGTGRISSASKFLLVVPPGESYPVGDTTIVLMQNTINNPILVTYPVRIVSTGDAWAAGCTGTFTSGTSSCLALGNGVGTGGGWQPGAYVQLKNLHPEYGELQKDFMSTPGYAYVLAPATQTAANDLTTAVDSRAFGGALWEFVSCATGTGVGIAGDYIFRNDADKKVLTLSRNEVVIGQLSMPTYLRIAESVPPASATSVGTSGQIAWGNDYIYVCVGTNTWKRAALSSWTSQTAKIAGDANLDGMVDVGDLGILAANYGGTGKTWTQGDFNGDGLVDVGDLGILAAHYGEGSIQPRNFSKDYAMAFGTIVENDMTDIAANDSLYSGLGLPYMAGLTLIGLMLVKIRKVRSF